jgi:HEAT repeat protein
MNEGKCIVSSIAEWLSNGDLRSDGTANEVADLVLQNPDLITDLLAGLRHDDKVVRGHAADALEKVARSSPELIVDYVDSIVDIAMHADVAMVRWHLAMIFGYLSIYPSRVGKITDALFHLLVDESAFVQSWSIVSLCIVARKYPQYCSEILVKIEHLKQSESVAVRSKVRQALSLLLDPNRPFPKGWIKNPQIDKLE